MKISARNQLKGTIKNVKAGAVNGVVSIQVGDNVIMADITMSAIEELGLETGKEAIAIVKASNVMFATQKIVGISARNQLEGTVVSVKEGAVNGHVKLELSDGNIVFGSITNDAIESLGLAEGEKAVALIKSTDVMVGVE